MARLVKYLSLCLAAILAFSVLLMIKPAFAQTIPKPAVPQITIELVKTSQMQPIFWGHPFNEQNISVQPDKESTYTIELIVKNQPFTPLKEKISGRECGIYLGYNVRLQINGSQNWITVYTPSNTGPSPTNSDYTIIPFSIQPSQVLNDNKTTIDSFYIRAYYVNSFNYSTVTGWIPDEQVHISFQVEALIGYLDMRNDVTSYPQVWSWVFVGKTSGWSPTQTVTIPGIPAIPSPTESNLGPTSAPAPNLGELAVTLASIAIMVSIVCVILLLLYVRHLKRSIPEN